MLICDFIPEYREQVVLYSSIKITKTIKRRPLIGDTFLDLKTTCNMYRVAGRRCNNKVLGHFVITSPKKAIDITKYPYIMKFV